MTNQRFRRQTEHETVSEQLSLYLDDQLSADVKAHVQTHLQTCESCREDLRSLRWTRRLLLETPPVKIPRSFVIREADVTPARGARRRPLWFATQWATAVVAMLLIVVLASDLLVGRQSPGAQEQPMKMVALEREVAVTVEAEMEQAVPAASTERAAEPEALTVAPAEAETPSPQGGGGVAERSGTSVPQVEAEKGEDTSTPASMEAATMEVPSRKAAPDEQTDLVTGTPPQLAASVVEATPEAEGSAEVALMTVPETVESENASSLTPGPEPLVTDGEPTVPFVPGINTVEPQRTGWAGIGAPTWRVVEIVLGIALAGLLIATVWIKRQSG